MAGIIEYTLSLNDRLSSKLAKIGINNSKQLEIWGKVQQRVVSADNTLRKCGVTIGSLSQRIAALRAEREWIPASNVKAIRATNQEITSLEKQMRRLENVNGRGIRGWFDSLKRGIPILGQLTNPILLIAAAVYKTTAYIKSSGEAYNTRIENEAKLAKVMRNTMGAGREELDSILQLTDAQERLGVISRAVQTAGSQELATYLSKASNLRTLIPVMNDMLAQQYGINASQEQAVTIAQMMGKVMDGQVGALSRYGYKFDEVQEQILKYGTEVQRAATLAEVVTSSVGGVNAAIAATDPGRMKQYGDTLGTIKERVGAVYTAVKMSLLPVFEWFRDLLGEVVGWFERHQDSITTIFQVIGKVVTRTFSIIGKVLGAISDALGWFWEKLKEGNVPITILTILVGSLVTTMFLFALWAKIAAAKTFLWAKAQALLNAIIHANPVFLLIMGIIAFIAVIAFLCYKIDGWGTLWKGTIGVMKYGFLGFVESVKLGWNVMISGILNGLDRVMIGWYKFKEAVGLGDSEKNQAAIARLNDNIEARKKAVAEGAGKVAEYNRLAAESAKSIDLKWNSDKKLSDITAGVKKSLGISEASVPGMADGLGADTGEDGGGMAGAVEAVATGGKRSTTININLKSLVENIIFQGGYESEADGMQKDLESRLIQVLMMARSAQ